MHDPIACIVLLLFFSARFSCFHTKDKEKNHCWNKDTNLVIQRVNSDEDKASINCPGLEANKTIFHITLHKDTMLHFTDFQKAEVTNTSIEKQRFGAHVENNTVDYVIHMPHVNDTGLYNCTVTYGDAVSTTYTFLLITDPEQSCLPEGQSVVGLLLVVGCGLLALYNFITTIASCSFALKLKHRDAYQNDYFNTRPGEFSRVK